MSRLTPISTVRLVLSQPSLLPGLTAVLKKASPLDGSADIHVSGTSRELGVVHVSVDVEVGGNLVVGDNSVGGHVVALVVRDIEDSVGGHVVAAIFGVCSMKDFSSLFSTTPSKLDKDVELDILVL